MCKLVLDGGSVSSFTSVSNVFIDEYMNKANGEFVKIYLHLLRMVSKMNDAPEEFSTEKIADNFGILESDVYRALTYWNDEEVLSLSFNDEGKIEGVLLNNYIQTKAASGRILHQDESVDVNLLAKASGESVAVPASASKEFIIPAKKKRTASEITRLAEDSRIRELCFLAEQYLSITLSPAATNSIIYMVEDLRLDSDLIEHLLESGDTSLASIEKKAVAYAKELDESRSFEITFWASDIAENPAAWAKLAKVVIMDSTTEAYKKAEEQVKAAKEAAKTQEQ